MLGRMTSHVRRQTQKDRVKRDKRLGMLAGDLLNIWLTELISNMLRDLLECKRPVFPRVPNRISSELLGIVMLGTRFRLCVYLCLYIVPSHHFIAIIEQVFFSFFFKKRNGIILAMSTLQGKLLTWPKWAAFLHVLVSLCCGLTCLDTKHFWNL